MTQYKYNFNNLNLYLQNFMSIEVIQKPGVEDAWYPFLNKIFINKNLKYRERFFSLMHEAGHVMIDKNIRQTDEVCFNKNRPSRIKSKRDFVHVMNEEILAWNYGKSLVKSLNMSFEESVLERYMADAIMSYTRSGLNSVYGKEINANVIYTKYV